MDDDDERLTALYDVHAGPIRRYVVRLTGDSAGADDVVQETLIRAWRTPRILAQDPTTTRAWMITVARHIVVDEVRSARRRHEQTVAELPERGGDDETDRLFDALLIEDALAALDPAHRVVIVAAYYRGRSVGQVAAELGIPEGTVKSRMHYGLRALRLALQERGVTR
ncbi:sigma-70 family RNA polymerase sigma factor [Microbacterium capsulatum]|uniref:Sigma-70 family RNA polymerase sigma factor n=1 Tax=Microbacterium capsulatum TaxID=3041921 RepID=A0ABU0XFW3_9MICO|nr:sigma-70 family RNA polymerase sigma factor [Microbacterium sp. ASV81]MDQ4213951.1 sigma-70 family RNA polymerase sigma factor [Microbacterium sp. ASV81]